MKSDRLEKIGEGQVCEWQTTSLYGNQPGQKGMSSELKFRFSRPSPAFAKGVLTITGDKP
jgi:hypothetical protein